MNGKLTLEHNRKFSILFLKAKSEIRNFLPNHRCYESTLVGFTRKDRVR